MANTVVLYDYNNQEISPAVDLSSIGSDSYKDNITIKDFVKNDKSFVHEYVNAFIENHDESDINISGNKNISGNININNENTDVSCNKIDISTNQLNTKSVICDASFLNTLNVHAESIIIDGINKKNPQDFIIFKINDNYDTIALKSTVDNISTNVNTHDTSITKINTLIDNIKYYDASNESYNSLNNNDMSELYIPNYVLRNIDASYYLDMHIKDGDVVKTINCGEFNITGNDAAVVYNGDDVSLKRNLYVNNDVSVNNNIYANYIYSESDERLKTFTKPIDINLDTLSGIKKSYFKFTGNPNKAHIGVSAQEIQKLYPEIVHENNETGFLSVDYAKLSVVALAAVDKLNEEIKNLKEEINKLKK